MKYNIAVNSPGDCYAKLGYVLKFSEFLTERCPEAHMSKPTIDRALMVQYMRFLREEKIDGVRRLKLLSGLRVFLETCAFRLEMAEVPREQIIYNDDFPKITRGLSREIPDGVLAQLREHLNTLPTTILRMVVILLECGLRINECCSLPLNCLTCEDKQHWFLHFYQIKSKQEHIIPIVEETVVTTIQAQQQFIREQHGVESPYLFHRITSHQLPFKTATFAENLNRWARKYKIRDAKGELYRFETHQFRHTVGMRLINDDVPIDVISRLFGHHSLMMTQIYAHKRDEQVAEDLERAGRKSKTVNYQGQIVRGDSRANAPDAQLLRKGIRGQTLPLGGCGRLLLLGDCDHANKCLTCPSWLTSTEDLPGLKAFYGKAIYLKQRALEVNNSMVLQNQDKIIPLLSIRINSLEAGSDNDPFSADELLSQLRIDLAEAEAGREEAQEAGFIRAVKYLERRISELKSRIAGLEEAS
jgi:integrase/recombinase XerD